MYERVAIIDLETTGADPYSDHIIEVGALIWEGEKVADTFSKLAQSPVPLSPGIVKLTGIDQSMLEDAPELDTVLDEFLAFLPDGILCIAHNASFERAFLRNATKDRFQHTVLDTVELSRICFPLLPSHSLTVLAETLELPDNAAHRALADCETLLQLWLKILEKALQIPLPVVTEIKRLLEPHRKHPYREFFQLLEAEILTRSFGQEAGTIEKVFKDGVFSPPPPPLPDEDEAVTEIDTEQAAALFSAEGKLAARLGTYEERPGQEDMVRRVSEAFNSRKHLLIEAGTGIGKSLAYLVPSVMLASSNNTPVIISTNTKNLQAQLFEKDIPLVKEILEMDFAAALIKGRRNYLCLRKLFYLLRQAAQELDNEERMRLVNVLPWAAWTGTGDIAENIVSGRPGFGPVWNKLATVGDECLGKACRHQKRCFLRIARSKALAAQIVVANHSLVFSEMNIKSPALPPYAHLIFDEAHNIEDAATSHLSVEISPVRLHTPLSRLHRQGRRKKVTGLISSIEALLASHQPRTDGGHKEMATSQCADIHQAIEETIPLITPFFENLEVLLKGRRRGEATRFYGDRKLPDIWGEIEESKVALLAVLGKSIHAVSALIETIREIEGLQYQRDFLRDLDASCTWIKEVTEDIEFVLDGANSDYVYWAEKTPPRLGGIRVVAAPRVVGAMLHDQVYSRKQSVIFCSATMTVRRSFDFLKKRLGIDLIEEGGILEHDAGTPFDYEKQCMVAAPLFLPEPGERERNYPQELGVLLAEVYRRTNGRGLALFTSYDMLLKVHSILQEEMLGDGITLLAQGQSGSRESITSIFKSDIHSILLGTHSFWEGVDVQGEALTCLTIGRLPFSVHTDPIVQARCEAVEEDGGNAFYGYSLPSAVIRYRQGFGRLIRHKTDRGIVIVADRRVVVKRYGQWFRDSIPAPTEKFTDREAFLDGIEEFLS